MAKTHWIPDEARGITQEQAQERVATGKAKWVHFTPAFVGTQVQTANLDEMLAHMARATRIYQKGRIGQAEGRVVVATTMPIAIFYVGDVHWGSIYTDHARFEREMAVIEKTPGAYVAFMSNLIDNAIPSQYPANMLANGLPPDKQVVAMRKIVERLAAKGKVLGAVTSPCHEGWTYKHTGQDINALIFGFEGRKFPVLDNGGRLNLKVGRVRYVNALYHMVGPFESNFNETHALRQMNRLNLGMEADIVCGAHKHFAAVQMVYEGVGERRKPVAYIRTGTYKGINKAHDQFAVQRYGVTGEPSAQCVVLHPDKKRMEVFLEFESGIEALEAMTLYEMAR